ncbi:MAG: hypothetical protein CMI18_01840 [Opitutaceae bacterium]|nr:hypothetical protein [Opitutaceae bacterium]
MRWLLRSNKDASYYRTGSGGGSACNYFSSANSEIIKASMGSVLAARRSLLYKKKEMDSSGFQVFW